MMETGFATAALAVLADASLKASVVIAAAGIWIALHRSASASVRHVVWTFALIAASALVLLVPILPAWRVAVPLPASTVEEAAEAPGTLESMAAVAPASTGMADALPEPVDEGAPTAIASSQARHDGPGPWVVLFAAWLTGALAVLTPFVRGLLRLRRIEKTADPVRSAAVLASLHEVSAESGVGREIRLLAGPRGAMPMTWGVFRPVIFVPSDVRSWRASRVRAVFRHEIAHIARWDALTHAAGEIACALHWFNPLVWLAAKLQREEREHACDDRVLACGAEPADYASELVELARALRHGRAAALAGMAMARSGSLKGRLVAVLDEERSRHPARPGAVRRGVLLAGLSVLPLACLAPARADLRSANVAEAERAVTVAPAAIPASLASADAAPTAPTLRAVRASMESPEAPTPAVPSPPAAPVVPAYQGNGSMAVRVLRQAVARRLSDRPMADLLVTAVEAGAITDGSDLTAYLEAASTISSDRDRTRALEAYIATDPDSPALVRVIGVAVRAGADRELAGVLVKIAAVRPVQGELASAYRAAAETIRSDRYRREALEAIGG